MDWKTPLFSVMAIGLASSGLAQADAPAVIKNYADIAQAGYADSLSTALTLKERVAELIAAPSENTLTAAKLGWLDARVPYQQTEVYRFGNAIVDDWEGKVNAWPLDEGLIDYVDSSYGSESDANDFYTANIIAHSSLLINGQTIDASVITPELLATELHEAGGIESNVATGYHAIEFLLWGQDLNAGKAGAGNRLHTDFDTGNCTNEHCDRRSDYLVAVTDLLVSDLQYMATAWAEGGDARTALNDLGEDGAIAAMLTGMGSLSYGELAGERMQLGLMLHDPEEEHDCFADNTSASHYYDGLGIQNVLLGQYKRSDGGLITGPSLLGLIKEQDNALAQELKGDLENSVAMLAVLLESQHEGQAYDQLIAEGNVKGNAIVQDAIDALIAQTRTIERVVVALDVDGVAVEGSDSLDDPSAVFQ
ncbi:MAG: imelysin family protein [Granulosicoccus sp.]